MKINKKFTRLVGVGLSVAMLATTVLTAVPAMALTVPVVTTNNTGISQSGTWDIRFSVDNAIIAGGNITVTWGSGFTLNTTSLNTTGYTIAASQGWTGPTTFENAVLLATNSTTNASARTIIFSLGAGDKIGASAQVRILLPVGVVTNPSTPGSYSLTVITTNDTTAVTSNNVIITLPNLGPMPGLVQAKNSNGDLLYQAVLSDLTPAINTPGVSRIELAAGTYNASNTANVSGQTIIGVGANGTVIMTAPAGSTPLTVSAVNVTLQNLIFQGNPNSVDNLLAITANNTNIVNSTFNGGVNQVNINTAVSNNRTTLSNSTFNVTGNVTAGISTNGRITTTNCTFNVDNGGTAIIASNGGVTATSSVFNGSTGTGAGIVVSGNSSSAITSSNFTNLGNNALAYSGVTINSTQAGSTLTVTGSNFNGCGNTSATSSTTDGVITASGAGDLILINNTISNSAAAAYGLYVSGGNVTARFNTISNTLNVKRTSGTADAVNNWWGSINGPASSSISGTVATSPYLTSTTTAATVVFNSANLSGGTPGALPSGIEVSSLNATSGATLPMSSVTAAKYTSNPQNSTPIGTVLGYYDVYVAGTVDGATITIKFYAGAAVNENTKVYYGGGLTGAWTLASSQGVNPNSDFVFVTVTGVTSPSIADLGRLPFVVTNVAPALVTPTLVGPTGTSVPLNTGFSWNTVTGADTYNFQVSTVSNFATTVTSQTGLTATVAGGVALTSNTTYFWRVQAVNVGGTSAWATGTFTTNNPATSTTPPPVVTVNVTPTAPVVNIAPAQVTVTPPNITVNPPQVTVTAPPPANVTVNPPQVTVTAPPAPNVTIQPADMSSIIPPYILWTIILIGAVLVIALIVLIVRTRRVA